jgi:hypothetical protein
MEGEREADHSCIYSPRLTLQQQETEQKKDMEELSALAAQGKPVYGPSDLPEHIQGVAHRNSVFSQLVGIAHLLCI